MGIDFAGIADVVAASSRSNPMWREACRRDVADLDVRSTGAAEPCRYISFTATFTHCFLFLLSSSTEMESLKGAVL